MPSHVSIAAIVPQAACFLSAPLLLTHNASGIMVNFTFHHFLTATTYSGTFLNALCEHNKKSVCSSPKILVTLLRNADHELNTQMARISQEGQLQQEDFHNEENCEPLRDDGFDEIQPVAAARKIVPNVCINW